MKNTPQEKSFTLFETIIALGLLVTMVLEVTQVQGNAIEFSGFNRKMTQASWLAKGLMAQVEHRSKLYPFKEFKLNIKDEKFQDVQCPEEPMFDCNYTYNITIEPWDLPLVDLVFGKSSDGEENPMYSMIKDEMKKILGDEFFKVAQVEVFWPEGSKRNSVVLTELFTVQNAVDDYIETLKPIKDVGPTPNGGDTQCKEGYELREGKCVAKQPGGVPGGDAGTPIPEEKPTETDYD